MIYTNVRILHTVDSQDVIGDLKYELEAEEINVGMHCVQHHDVVKLGCIFDMINKIDKIDTLEWSDRLQKMFPMFLKYRPKIYLQACKINYGSFNKITNDLKFKVLNETNRKHGGSCRNN